MEMSAQCFLWFHTNCFLSSFFLSSPKNSTSQKIKIFCYTGIHTHHNTSIHAHHLCPTHRKMKFTPSYIVSPAQYDWCVRVLVLVRMCVCVCVCVCMYVCVCVCMIGMLVASPPPPHSCTLTHTFSHTLKGNTHLLGLCRRSKIICYASVCWQCVGSVLQCAAACEYIFFDCVVGTILFATPQRGAVCCSVLAVCWQCVAVCAHTFFDCAVGTKILATPQCVAVCCSVLQLISVYSSV